MELIKKLLSYVALITVLIAVAVYGIPLLKGSGNNTVNTGVTAINNLTNAVTD